MRFFLKKKITEIGERCKAFPIQQFKCTNCDDPLINENKPRNRKKCLIANLLLSQRCRM